MAKMPTETEEWHRSETLISIALKSERSQRQTKRRPLQTYYMYRPIRESDSFVGRRVQDQTYYMYRPIRESDSFVGRRVQDQYL